VTRRSLAAAPAATGALLLLTATFFEGAFDIRNWAPVALFALALVTAFTLSGAIQPLSRPIQIALAAIWAFAGWTLLSATWADSVALAWEGAGIAILYAALVTVALTCVPGPRQMSAIGAVLVIGVVAVAVVTLVRMHVEGTELFVAGRLDSPVGYRNATATLFALAFWPLIGIAVTRGRNPSLRAGTVAAAVLCLGLAFLTQSRGVIVGLALGGVVALALATERIRRVFLGLLALGGVLVLSGPLLAPARSFDDGPGPVTSSDIASATNALTFLVVDALIVGMVLALLDGGLRASVKNLARARRIAVVTLVIGAVGLLAGGVLAVGDPIDFVREKVDEFQAVESRSSEFSEIVSSGGQRSDLWRVALDQFAGAPIVGAGEGGYGFAYYADRETDRNLTNAHSLPLELLGELGIVGALLLATFVAAIGLAIARGIRRQPILKRHAVAGLAAAGAVALGQATVDWIWLVPGVMGIGLFCLALAAGMVSPEGARPRQWALGRRLASARGRAGRLGQTAWLGLREGLPVAGLVTAALVVLSIFLSDYFVREARTAASPQDSRTAATRAEDLNPWALTPRYLQAGALEDRGRVDAARAELRAALSLEPRNFVTLGLLGDLEVRADDDAAAWAYYRRAAELNPLDAGLAELRRSSRRQARGADSSASREVSAAGPERRSG
jgi:hypothetical protein